MTQTLSQEALARALDYLQSYGVPLTREVTLTVLQLIATALAENTAADDLLQLINESASSKQPLIAQVMEALPAHFPLPEISLPQTSPPIARTSIGYEKY